MGFNPMELETGDKASHPHLGLSVSRRIHQNPDGWRIAKRTEQKSWTHNVPGFMKLLILY